MPPRPRSFRTRLLPSNLYESSGYYSWRDPRNGKHYGLGRDRQDAINQAIEANNEVRAAEDKRLVDRLAEPERTIGKFADTYLAKLEARDIAAPTKYQRKRQALRIKAALGDIEIGARQEDATELTRRCAQWLGGFEKQGKQRMAQALRTTLDDMFAGMAAVGWLAVNPAAVIKVEPAKVRRMRLTLESFQAIYEAAGALQPWARRSLELGVVTLQRREDVARMRFSDLVAGKLQVEQIKTGMRLRIPPELRLDALGWSLNDVMRSCRDSVLSKYLLHHTQHRGPIKPGMALYGPTLGDGFRQARELAGIQAEPGKTLPSFHELRSLGIRLYKAQGYDPQALAGHKDPKTTAIYRDVRGAEWIDVAA